MKFFHAFFTFVLLASLSHGEIRIGGSDLLKPNFSEALNEFATSSSLKLEVDFSGSYPAYSDLKNGKIDLALLAIPSGQEMPEERFETVNIASKVLAIAVPPENPLNQITLHQLWAVFGDAEGMSRWGELGLTGEWAQRSIVVRSISRAEHTLAVDLFRHHVLETGNMRSSVAEFSGIETLRNAFREEVAGIALLDRVPSDEGGLKILPIARRDTDFAHSPTPESIASDDYPLRLPLYLVYPKEKAAELKEILRFFISSDATRAIEADGLTARPRQHRDRLQLEFERL